MAKVFGYECRRLLGRWVFWGLAAVTLWFSWQSLTNAVIWGISNTAPFSPWSYGYFLAKALPFLCAVELFFVSFYISKNARDTSILIDATPVRRYKYVSVCCGAIASGITLLTICLLGMWSGYFGVLFGVINISQLLTMPVLVLAPALILALGAGWFFGHYHPAFVYGLIAVFFITAYLPLPYWADPFGDKFFSQFPLMIGTIDPELQVPSLFMWSRIVIAAVGVLLFFLGVRRKRR